MKVWIIAAEGEEFGVEVFGKPEAAYSSRAKAEAALEKLRQLYRDDYVMCQLELDCDPS